MSNVRISQLPTAPSAITGAELVPIVQNGQTVQTTVSSIISSPSLTQTFLTATNQTSLPNSRYLSATTGIGITDNGAQSTLQLTLNGTSGSLEASGYGIIAKTNTNTIVPITITAGTGGLSISNGSGVSGNPTVSLTGAVLAMAAVTGTGLLTSSAGGTSIGTTTISGTANQIAVTNGNSAPVIGLASNAVLPGTASITLPAGATAARPASPANGMIRYNTDTASLEAYTNSAWGAIVSGSGVSTFSAGSTGLTPATATSGGIVLGGTLNASSGGTGASGTLTGYVYGNGSSAMTASTTIPTTSLSGTITNAQLANSSFTINGTSISLGGTSTITAVAPYALTIGTGLSGTSYNGSSAVTVAIASTGVSAGTYGSALAIPQITVNAQGQITSITTNASGATTYQGTWNAATNTPTLTSSVGTNGYYYVVSTAGTTSLNGINLWSVGDWAVFNGSVWEKVLGSSSEAFNSITVTGLTGFMYANGTSAVTNATTAQALSLIGVVPVTNGGTGSASTVSTIASFNNFAPGYTNVPTAGGTTTLTNTATFYQNFSGTNTQTVKLPAENTILAGTAYIIDNDSTGNITVQDSAGNLLATAVPGGAGWIYSTSASAATGNWAGYLLPPGNSSTGLLTWGSAGLNMASSYIQGVTTLNMSGQLTNTVANGTAPFVVSSTTTVANLGATNTVNTAITAASTGTTNYLTFVTATSGNLPQLVNSSITCNATNGTITGGIVGGAF